MGDMVYITTANAAAIVQKIDPKRLARLNGTLYKKSIYVFGKRDKVRLLAIKELFKDPEYFIREYYLEHDRPDTGKYVFEESKPAYHLDAGCDRLTADYINYIIPESIRDQGRAAIAAYREWFRANMYLLSDRPAHFQLRFKTQYGIWIEPQQVELPNSGITKFKPHDQASLEKSIDDILARAAALYNSNDLNRGMISNWGKNAWLGRRPGEPLRGNKTGADEDSIRSFLRDYEGKIILPLKRNLIEYYKIELNPRLEFGRPLLDQLGFVPCQSCYSAPRTSRDDLDELCAKVV